MYALQKIAQLTEIDKKITCHIARHTFENNVGDKTSPQMQQNFIVIHISRKFVVQTKATLNSLVFLEVLYLETFFQDLVITKLIYSK